MFKVYKYISKVYYQKYGQFYKWKNVSRNLQMFKVYKYISNYSFKLSKAFAKIIWNGKILDLTKIGCESIEMSSQNSYSYDVGIKKISIKKINLKE